MTMNAWDKLSVGKEYEVEYIIKANDGMTYIARKQGIAENVDFSKVVFPNDFVDEKTNLPAYANCTGNAKYDWSIMVNRKDIDDGYLDFGRRRR
jgi:hypothetical protein